MKRKFIFSVILCLSGALLLNAMDSDQDATTIMLTNIKKGTITGIARASVASAIKHVAIATAADEPPSARNLQMAKDILQGSISGALDGAKKGFVEVAMVEVEKHTSEPTQKNLIKHILTDGLNGIDAGIGAAFQNDRNLATGAAMGLTVGVTAGVIKSLVDDVVDNSLIVVTQNDVTVEPNLWICAAIGAAQGVSGAAISYARDGAIGTIIKDSKDSYCTIS